MDTIFILFAEIHERLADRVILEGGISWDIKDTVIALKKHVDNVLKQARNPGKS